MERNFLMSVSHELRTPLTAIRGHVAALLEGVVDDPELREQLARDGRGRGAAARAARRRHPRPREARHAPLHGHDRGGRHGAARSTRRSRRSATRRGAASIDYRVRGARPAGDRLRRRPRAPGRRQPALERVPGDAGRRPRSRSSSRSENGTVHVAVEDTGPGIPRRARERLFRPFVSERAAAPASGSRSRRSSRRALGGRHRPRVRGRPRLALRAGAAGGARPARARGLPSAERHDVSASAFGRRAQPRSGRAARSSTRQPSVSRSTSSARSSTRASARDSRVARCARAGGSRCSTAPYLGEAARDRRGLLAQASRSASRTLVHGREATVRGRMDAQRARLRPAAGADRPAPGRAARRVAPARLRARDRRGPRTASSASCRTSCRRDARGRERHAGRAGADPDRAAARRGAAARAARRGRVGGARAADAAAARRAAATAPVELLEHLGEGRWRVRLDGEPAGEPPLPPYITEPLADAERYQTVYARERGSAAAPTAGLHFTPELLARLDVERVTLHVGLDTFRPLQAEDVEEHRDPRRALRGRAGARGSGSAPRSSVLAVGTTTVRVLETLARGAPLAGRTELFITPGFEFRRVDRAADELPPAALDAARARDGVRGRRGDPPPLPARDRRALPLLLLRRCDADPVTALHFAPSR